MLLFRFGHYMYFLTTVHDTASVVDGKDGGGFLYMAFAGVYSPTLGIKLVVCDATLSCPCVSWHACRLSLP